MMKNKFHIEMRKLTRSEKRAIEQREKKYKDKLAELGYESRVLIDQTGCFAIVMVEDPVTGRKGLMLPNGKVRWTDEAKMAIGGLADTVVSGVNLKKK
jgi:hypothetical protein